MASIGKFIVSALSATQETQFSLANFHVDFSMIKLTAPDEYKRIGQHTSRKRKTSAEDGSLHRTARQLGALFEGVLPEVPHLMRAYGLRASEIADSPRKDPAIGRKHNALQEHLGVDGGAHWAAATSGPNSLRVLLLACVLARSWKAPEAVSIWTELVSTRKSILQKRLQGSSFDLNTITASQLDISRHALAEWDDSARAWLAFADSVMRAKYTQLMLIVDNLEMPTRPMNVYDSILEVWTESMTATDQLVSGIPFRVQKPHVLFGLAAWHIFPDLSILGAEQKLVPMHDPLVQPGGLLTVGVQTISPKISSGVSWTLPLKNLRYYGGTKITKGGISAASSHVSFETFLQVVIGSMVHTWGPHADDVESVTAFLEAFGMKAAETPAETRFSDVSGSEDGFRMELGSEYLELGPSHWPKAITDLSRSYLRGTQHHRKQFEQCVYLGRRRFGGFLASSEHHPDPGFGLCDPMNLLGMMSDEGAIQALRLMVQSDPELKDAIVIHERNGWSEIVSLKPETTLHSEGPRYNRWVRLTSEENWRSEKELRSAHILRFMHYRSPTCTRPLNRRPTEVLRALRIMRTLKESCGFVTLGANVIIQPIDWNTTEALEWASKSEDFDTSDGVIPDNVENVPAGWVPDNQPPPWLPTDYSCLWKFETMSVYVPVAQYQILTEQPRTLPLNFVTKVLDQDLLTDLEVRTYLERELYADDDQTDPYYKSLAILNRVEGLYTTLPDALVNLSILSMQLWNVSWQPEHLDALNAEESFACIASFATGQHVFAPSTFSNVIGISYGNTLYMLELLLNDPWTSLDSRDSTGSICCLVGNIGSPGLSLLLSVHDPMQSSSNLEDWRLVNHEDYDGKLEDNFRNTALQLSLTGYTLPVDTKEHGTRDKDAFFVETVISVHDQGQWVSDIDVLPVFRTKDCIVKVPKCTHTEEEMTDTTRFGRVRAVDGWPELIDPPLGTCVVRAHRNWVARLALCAVGYAQQDQWLICDSRVCWMCVWELATRKRWDISSIKILC